MSGTVGEPRRLLRASTGVDASRGASPVRAAHAIQRLDLAIVVAVGFLGVFSVWAILGPEPRLHLVAPGLDVSFETITTLVTAGIVSLAWLVYREGAERLALYQASAFLVLATANLAALIVAIAILQGATAGPTGADASVYIFTAARTLAAAVLVLGGLQALAPRPRIHPGLVLSVPLVSLLGVVGLVAAVGPSLPALVASSDTASVGAGAQATALGAILQLPGAVLFLWASGMMRTLHATTQRVGAAYLAIGLLIAAFGQAHLAVFPAGHAGIVTSADILRLAFDASLLLGIGAEARSSIRALRAANATLERLREADAERAALAERARVSREFHDGLAQDLWVAKLRTGRLLAVPGLAPEAAALCAEVDSAIDDGLAAARHAIAALRFPVPQERGLAELVETYVADFGDRFGIGVEVECDADLPPLAPRVEAELVRIVQEALNNVRRHADATLVRVRLRARDGVLALSVEDNGRGFEVGAVHGNGFGLESMRERASIARARLAIDSRPHDGTRVLVELAMPRVT